MCAKQEEEFLSKVASVFQMPTLSFGGEDV